MSRLNILISGRQVKEFFSSRLALKRAKHRVIHILRRDYKKELKL